MPRRGDFKTSNCDGVDGLPIPRQEFVEAGGRMIADPAEHVGQPGAWIDVVQLGRLCRTPDYAELPSRSRRLLSICALVARHSVDHLQARP
jgi:hypothetical protein